MVAGADQTTTRPPATLSTANRITHTPTDPPRDGNCPRLTGALAGWSSAVVPEVPGGRREDNGR
jgi:hypothetical protein